jgi:stress-induced-phosphoprotein 1
LKDYKAALEDAEETVKLNPSWAKGFSRLGAAFFGLARYEESMDAYKKGLTIDPSYVYTPYLSSISLFPKNCLFLFNFLYRNEQLKKGLEDAKTSLESDNLGGGLGKLFQGDVLSKIASNPKLSSYLSQPDFIQMVQNCQRNPNMINA